MFANYKYEKTEKVSHKDTIDLIKKYNDWIILDTDLFLLINSYSSLIKKISIEQHKRYRLTRTEESLEECYNEGVIWLLRWFKKFNWEKWKNFANYFYRYIGNEISEYISSKLFWIKFSEKFALLLASVQYESRKENFNLKEYINTLKETEKTKNLLLQYLEGFTDTEFLEEKEEEITKIKEEDIVKIVENTLTKEEQVIFYWIRWDEKKSELLEKINNPKIDTFYKLQREYEKILDKIKLNFTNNA